ncbi:MAG: hypothetical protein RI513_01490 [Balneolaceae bacterium]|nr:hypothetical protein [Balneolaceae bacterium]
MMNRRFIDLLSQTYTWPQPGLDVSNHGTLKFHGLDLFDLAKEYGTPLRFHHIPSIRRAVEQANGWFDQAIQAHQYQGEYIPAFATKSSPFRFALEETTKAGCHIETSSAVDLEIVQWLLANDFISSEAYILCNGFKSDRYLDAILRLHKQGMQNLICILDNELEAQKLLDSEPNGLKIGFRVATEEDPSFEFYTSRLGMKSTEIMELVASFSDSKVLVPVMIHFFINTGIRDTAYFWNEFIKACRLYTEASRVCSSIQLFNIGGGLPIKKSLDVDVDQASIIRQLVGQIKLTCEEVDTPHPTIMSEFGSFYVGESGGLLMNVVLQKSQNDRERWNMLDGSIMSNLPDAWAISQRFITLPTNGWFEDFERVSLGGMTCDGDDYYNDQGSITLSSSSSATDQEVHHLYMPTLAKTQELFVAFLHTGAYQETVGGYGGLQHCLLPEPKHVLVREIEGKTSVELFRDPADSTSILSTLGY